MSDSASTSSSNAHPASRDSQESAIEIRDGCKSYGSGKNKTIVLNHIDLTVPTGAIYGLLGPSGCGKTTLLNTIVNRLSLDHGSVLICGYKPGSVEAAVPGHRVGFMPQELALMPALTIGESLQYFGRIHNLGKQKTKERTDFLISFLDLPTPTRLISQLSGGQQRRVSFAVALLHEPELLILDEPTVGVDPLLRTNIWEHLNKVSKSTNATIIITTHYIEEARQASRVGLMRRGHLLAEASPDNLMKYFGNPSLEDVFLRLCLRDGGLDPAAKKNSGFEKEEGIEMESKAVPDATPSEQTHLELVLKSSTSGTFDMLQEPTVFQHTKKPWTTTSKRETYLAWGRFSALTIKNAINLTRNTMFLILSFLLPLVQTVLFCVAIGGTPKGLHVAVTNLDEGIGNFSISDLYLRELDDEIIIQENYDTFDGGYEAVNSGQAWGLLFFDVNYTQSFNPLEEQNDVYEKQIHVFMDSTNQMISYTILLQIFSAFQALIADVTSLDITNIDINSPIKIEDPVYGTKNPTFTEFMAPGVILTLSYFMAMALTSVAFVIEKKEGLYNRALVAGVNNLEIMLAHLVTQLVVLIIQIAIILVFMFAVFKIPCEGSMGLVILLALLQGLCGMTFGYFISVSVEDEMTAFQAAMGVFYPILLLSGVVWPVQGMPTFLRYISYILPQTYACESIRAILYRGWGFSHLEVYLGYIITVGWMILHVSLSALVLKIKH